MFLSDSRAAGLTASSPMLREHKHRFYGHCSVLIYPHMQTVLFLILLLFLLFLSLFHRRLRVISLGKHTSDMQESICCHRRC